MKEMEYLDYSTRICLDLGTKNGFEWYILSLGYHPCAYVKLPENHPCSQLKEYDDFAWLDCHGGITYVENMLFMPDNEILKGNWIGWDYNHYMDYSGNQVLHNVFDYFCWGCKKWTTQEIRNEVFDVIRQLMEKQS